MITLKLIVDAAGNAYCYANGQLMFSVQETDLATGGTLATGKPGVCDQDGGFAIARTIDNFLVQPGPTADAAVFSARTAQWRYDSFIRDDPTAVSVGKVGKFEGDYLLVPPAGKEARTAQFIVKASRLDQTSAAKQDVAIDSIKGQLTTIPRYLVIPEN